MTTTRTPGLLEAAPDLRSHRALHGPLPALAGRLALVPAVEAAELRGRGGAGFPTARKLRAVAGEAGRRGAVVVGNGAEGEPASRKDAALLTTAPHLVLDGLQLAADCVGARRVVLAVQREPGLRGLLERALAERDDPVRVELVGVPDRFLAGEASALLQVIAGRPALPTPKRVPTWQAGVAGRPTLVQNVETLARLALVARGQLPDGLLVTSHDTQTTVQEVPYGTPVADVVDLDGSQALLVGGYHGTWFAAEDARQLELGPEPVFGAGVLAALPSRCCGLLEMARVVRYLARESAGQCGPCLNGLPRIAGALAELARPGADPALVDDVARWSGLVVRRGACHHPDGSVRFVRSGLEVFSDELVEHLAGSCTADRAGTPYLPVPDVVPTDRDWS